MSVEDMLNAIKSQLEDHEKRIAYLEKRPDDKGETTTKKLSIREIFISKKPKTDVDKTLLVGYYLEIFQDYTSFNVSDIEVGFRSAKEPPPGNISDVVNKNIRKGFIMSAEEKKDNKQAWVLTNLGIQYVDNDLKKQ
jgi:hypothetical protein